MGWWGYTTTPPPHLLRRWGGVVSCYGCLNGPLGSRRLAGSGWEQARRACGPTITVSSAVLARYPDMALRAITERLDRVQVQGRQGGLRCTGLGGVVIRWRSHRVRPVGRRFAPRYARRFAPCSTSSQLGVASAGFRQQCYRTRQNRPIVARSVLSYDGREPAKAGPRPIQHYLVRP